MDGNAGEELSADHVEHAKKVLQESQKKAKTRADEKSPKVVKTEKVSAAKLKRAKVPTRNTNKVAAVAKQPTGEKVTDTSVLSLNQQVLVTLGKTPMKGVIVDIAKSEAKVQLTSGMVVKVKPEHLLATK